MAATETPGRQAWIVASLLALQALLLGYSATRHSPVHLEPAFLASGISHWKFARFELYRANPPLPRMISAVPVLLAGCETDWTNYFDGPGARPEYPCGDDFIEANGPRSLWLFTLARLAGIPINLLGAYLAYRWSRELFGWRGGLLTLVLFVVDPNLLAYGEFATPDAAFTAFGILACYTFWRWLRDPTWTMAAIAGAALGLAELSKLSWLILYGLWPLLWAVWRLWPQEQSTPSQASPIEHPRQAPLLQLGGMLLISLYIINLAYVFDGFGTRLRDFEFVSTTLTGLPKPGLPGNRFRDAWVGSIPVPLPKQYVLGIDTQGKDLQDYPGKSYLRGVWKEGGWWYYYLYGFLVKEPLSVLVLLGLALVTSLKSVSRDELILLTPALALLAVTSSGLEFNIHWRYVLPVVGFGCVWAGRVARTWQGSPAATAGITSLVLMSIVSLASIYPQHLTYFNALAGGPRHGYQHLLGSSLDWGQDLIELSKVLQRPEFGDRTILVVVPERGSPESLDLFPSHVRIVSSVNEASLPRDRLILRSRYLPPTIESCPGPIDARRFHSTWSVHFLESSRGRPPP